MEGEVQTSASAHLVGATVGTVSSASVGRVDFGEVLHTPTSGGVWKKWLLRCGAKAWPQWLSRVNRSPSQ